MKVKQRCGEKKQKGLAFRISLHISFSMILSRFSFEGKRADLDEHRQAVVRIAGRVQVVLVLLGDVRHQHVYQRLHRVVERRREALVPGELRERKFTMRGVERFFFSTGKEV